MKKIHDRLLHFFFKSTFLTPCHFDFRAGMDTSSAVGRLVSFLKEAFSVGESGGCLLGLFCDLRRAFEVMNHTILLNKLHIWNKLEVGLRFILVFSLSYK